MARLVYLFTLLALNASNFFLSKYFLSPFLPSELKIVEAFFTSILGQDLAQQVLKFDLLLLWLGANLLLLQIVFLAFRKTNPYEGLPLGWFIFSFLVPFMAADYSFDYKNQSFGEYIDARVRLITSNDSYPNRYGRQLVTTFDKKRPVDLAVMLTKVAAPKLGELTAYGTLTEGCVNQYLKIAENFSTPPSFACQVLAKLSDEKKSPFEMEATCFSGPAFKVVYALDQGGVSCPVGKADLTHYTKICAFMKDELKISPISTCRMLGIIPMEKIKAMMAPHGVEN